MSTSLYGTVKKIGSSYFTFDRIYNSRSEMENAMATDGVYHGRYVLVTYGNEQLTNSTNGGTIVLTNNTNVNAQYSVSYNTAWIQNYNLDIQRYHNIYDKTVWQKIFDGGDEKYIMVASLNARAPGLTINETYYSFNLPTNSSGTTYYTKTSTNGTVTEAKRKPSYPLPKWHETYSNELIYHLDMPMPLQLNLLDNKIEYFNAGLEPLTRSTYSGTETSNYIRWEHILKSGTTQVTSADFHFNIPALGQAISDAYDALYGVPMSGNNMTTGRRPFTTGSNFTNLKQETKNALSQTDYKGILYILDHIGLRASDGHYLLGSDWAASSNSLGHIDNKPDKITAISVNSTTGVWTFTAVTQ